ncbi:MULTISPECIES: hypothetical protein [unclassified Maridesulfovibrio]|uniref:hypothetical protein n=1 Tax=unclassified Maridesulfovibrio TaxID=2794999 RepID=UPI003B40F371
MSLWINWIIVILATVLVVWPCVDPRFAGKDKSLIPLGLGCAFYILALYLWIASDMWLWINWVLLGVALGLAAWARFSPRFKGTHKYGGVVPLIIAILVFVLDAGSWIAYGIWGVS